MSEVWVVYIPWDYQSAEIVGVFESSQSAQRAAKIAKKELSGETLIIQKCNTRSH